MSNVATSNWQAWVKKIPAKPTPTITLHVTADVDTHSDDFAFLKKRIPQGMNEKILLLDLKAEDGTVPAKNPQKIDYPESLKKDNQYSSIEIFFEGKKIKEIKDITVI